MLISKEAPLGRRRREVDNRKAVRPCNGHVLARGVHRRKLRTNYLKRAEMNNKIVP